MAKGARASSRKRNNAALRAKVFGPAHDARTERLSAKLLELASQPKPAREEKKEEEEEEEAMNIESEDPTTTGKADAGEDAVVAEMEVDEGQEAGLESRHKGTAGFKSSRIEKRTNGTRKRRVPRKAKNAVVFASTTRRRRGPGLVKGRG